MACLMSSDMRSTGVWLAALLAAGCEGESGDAMRAASRSAACGSSRAEAPRTAGPPAALPSFGRGFTDLTGVAAVAPFALPNEPRRMDPEPTAGLFGDLDGDGRLEVILSPTQLGAPAGHRSAHVYAYDRATGTLVHRGAFRTPGSTADDELQPMGALDLDGDGHVDWLYNRASAEISWGQASGGVTDPVPFDREVRILGPAYMSMTVDDLDEDGWLDVVVGTGYCCVSCRELHVFLRTAPRRFQERLDLLPGTEQGNATAVLSARFDEERVLAALGTPCGTSDKRTFFRRDTLEPAGYPHYAAFEPIPPEAFFREAGPAAQRGRDLSQWAPMGGAAQDIDHDGLLDLSVTLNNYPSVFQGRAGSRSFVDHTAQFGCNPARSDLGVMMIPWGVALVDLDLDGWADMVAAHGNDHGSWTDPRTFTGPQRTLAHWNTGGMRFADVSAALHLDRRGQWMSLAVDDLDEDGDPDLLVGGQGEMPRLYRNDIDRGHRDPGVQPAARGQSRPRHHLPPRRGSALQAPLLDARAAHARRHDRLSHRRAPRRVDPPQRRGDVPERSRLDAGARLGRVRHRLGHRRSRAPAPAQRQLPRARLGDGAGLRVRRKLLRRRAPLGPAHPHPAGRRRPPYAGVSRRRARGARPGAQSGDTGRPLRVL